MTVVSGNIRFMRICAGVRLGQRHWETGSCRRRQILAI